MAIKFGLFVPQGWRMDLAEIADPVEKYEAMTGRGCFFSRLLSPLQAYRTLEPTQPIVRVPRLVSLAHDICPSSPEKKSINTSVTLSGASSWTKCPALEMNSSFEPGISCCSLGACEGSSHPSSSPHATSTGTSIQSSWDSISPVCHSSNWRAWRTKAC